MPHGVPTPENQVLEFRAAYLELGNVCAAARQVGLNERTCFDIARRADEDPEFKAVRDRIRAKHLSDVEERLTDIAATLHERILVADPGPEDIAQIADRHGLKSLSYQNPKPAYVKGLVDLHKSLVTRIRVDAEKSGEIHSGPALVVVTKGEPEEVRVGDQSKPSDDADLTHGSPDPVIGQPDIADESSDADS